MAQETNFPGATFAKSPDEAHLILSAVPRFKQIVDCSLDQSTSTSAPDPEKRSMVECGIAECWKNGLIAEAFEDAFHVQLTGANDVPVMAKTRHIKREQVKQLKQNRAKMVNHLQNVGIFPTGFSWMLIQWFVLPVLLEVLKRWCLNWYFDEVTAAGLNGSPSVGSGDHSDD